MRDRQIGCCDALSRRRFLSVGGTLCPGFCFAATAHQAHITAVTFSPDGKQIVSGSQSGVLLRDSEGNAVERIRSRLDNVHDLRFSPDGKMLAIAGGTPGESGTVEFLRWPDGELIRRIENHRDVVYQVAFSSDGTKWISASADEVCEVRETGGTVAGARYLEHSRAVLAVTILPRAGVAVSASRDETLRVWDTTSGETLRTLHNHSRDVNALALQPVEQALPMVASASADQTVRFWQPTIGRMVRFARLPSEPLSLAWVAEGSKVLAGGTDGKARLIDPVTVKIDDTIEVGDGRLFSVDANPTDDHRVVIGGTRGLLKVLSI